MVAVLIQCGLQQVKVDRRHLRTQQGIPLGTHLLRELGALVGRGHNRALHRILSADAESREERADTDTGGSQVVDFIDLQHCVDLAGMGQNIADLIGGNGIQSAAEGVELDQIQLIGVLDIFGSGIKAAMVHPLVIGDQRALRIHQMGDGILCQDSDDRRTQSAPECRG